MTISPQECLPHRPPFLFLTSITDSQPGEHAQGLWTLDGTESFFQGHFPDNPVVPGVLITEAMAQIAGVAVFSGSRNTLAMIAHTDVRFKSSVRPPATIELTARCQRSLGNLHILEVRATCESRLIAQGHITLGQQVDKDGEL